MKAVPDNNIFGGSEIEKAYLLFFFLNRTVFFSTS